MMKNRHVFFILGVLFIAACADEPRKKVTAIVLDVYVPNSIWSKCLGSDYKTVLRLEDGAADEACGFWGEKGDTVVGYWDDELGMVRTQ